MELSRQNAQVKEAALMNLQRLSEGGLAISRKYDLQTIQKESVQLSAFKKIENGDKQLFSAILALVEELSRVITNDWTVEYKAIIVDYIINNFWDLRIDDIAYCFKKWTSGEYGGEGKIYHKPTVQTVCDILIIYRENKTTFMEENNILKHKQIVSEEKPYTDERVKQLFNELKEKCKEEKKEHKSTINSVVTKSNEITKCWIKEFDELRRKQSQDIFIDFEGKKMDINDFLEYKITNNK